jgi:hypothetical protein
MPEKRGEGLTAFWDSDVEFRFFTDLFQCSVSMRKKDKGLKNVVAIPLTIKNDRVLNLFLEEAL